MIEESSLKKKLQSKEMKILDPANDKHSAKILRMVRDELAKLVRKKKVKKSNAFFGLKFIFSSSYNKYIAKHL